jgi:MYXO-CTERM domain-containing protein
MHRRAIGLLLAAAALPLTPLAAQTDSTAQPPPTDTAPTPVLTPPDSSTPPPATESAPPPTITAPIATTPPVVTRPIVNIPTATTAEEPAAPAARRTVRTTRTVTRTEAPVRRAAPAEAAVAAPVAAAPAPAEPAPLAATPPVEEIQAAPSGPVDTVAPAPEPARTTSLVPWVIAGLALLAALVGLLAWRRRRTRVDEAAYFDEPVVSEAPVPYVEPAAPEPASYQEPIVPPSIAPSFAVAEAMRDGSALEDRPLAAERADEGFLGTAVAASDGEPHLEFEMRPVRAGVGDEGARVEFELGVANRGDARARDVRVSAWMLGAGSPRGSEMENALIERVDLDAGEDANIEASVALPRARLGEDAILPVVVAEARYRLPDGSEGRTRATYEVGVPDGEEMIYFDVENPSGLHDGVVAREVDELERA